MRQPVVAGQFYPLRPADLRQELELCFEGLKFREKKLFGAVCPHAGYLYSGKVAAHVYATLPKAETYILIGPNHTGYGSPVSVSQDSWKTPLGIIEPDLELGKELLGRIAVLDELGHRFEHSLEVQLPFLQYRFGEAFKLLPICMGLQDEETAVELGELIAKSLLKTGKKAVLIASSDFTHYQPAEAALKIDTAMIKAILELDVSGLYACLYKNNASVCGYGPIAAMLTASKILGATQGTLLKYANSGDVSGDLSAVVGYAAIVVE
ncbi:MAG: MEMO1 family protein [Methanosarcinaceae archaeon]|nr:MEMO1 family protein [Methanosarcinaceae archaeon]MDD4749899.1 MEMO1 family protein [Methanosarcinaceae archaeon]